MVFSAFTRPRSAVPTFTIDDTPLPTNAKKSATHNGAPRGPPCDIALTAAAVAFAAAAPARSAVLRVPRAPPPRAAARTAPFAEDLGAIGVPLLIQYKYVCLEGGGLEVLSQLHKASTKGEVSTPAA